MVKQSTQKIACRLLGHHWIVELFSPMGKVSHVRKCERCQKVESRVWDHSSITYIWVPGQLEKLSFDYWIIASTYMCYQDKAAELAAQNKGCKTYWLNDEDTIHKMELIGGVWPSIRFAADWMESSVLQSWKVARVLETGHLL